MNLTLDKYIRYIGGCWAYNVSARAPFETIEILLQIYYLNYLWNCIIAFYSLRLFPLRKGMKLLQSITNFMCISELTCAQGSEDKIFYMMWKCKWWASHPVVKVHYGIIPHICRVPFPVVVVNTLVQSPQNRESSSPGQSQIESRRFTYTPLYFCRMFVASRTTGQITGSCMPFFLEPV